jgi:hypothetical protein
MFSVTNTLPYFMAGLVLKQRQQVNVIKLFNLSLRCDKISRGVRPLQVLLRLV